MLDSWIDEAKRGLLARVRVDGSWGRRAGGRGDVETTSWAMMALEGARGMNSQRQKAEACNEQAASAGALAWLASHQRPDGSVTASDEAGEPVWATPLALLAWSLTETHPDARRRSVEWLLRRSGRIIPKTSRDTRVVGHDMTIIGWPWVEETHSWLEPTAHAVLALCRAGLRAHPRVEAGLKLIENRAVPSGGWNYGNSSVFGRGLRPQPGPTGLALLALAGGARSSTIDRATTYLHAELPTVRAASSLAWGLIGLEAWGERPSEADAWLMQTYRRVSAQDDAAPRLAPLILAGIEGSAALVKKGSTR